jgi:MFS family permease
MATRTVPAAEARQDAGGGQGVAMRNGFSAFRHRDFTLFWVGSLISSIGSWMQNVTVPFVMLFVMHTSPIWVGIATVSQFLPGVLFSPYAGAFADRFPRKYVVLVSQSVQALFALAMWAAWVADVRRPAVYVVLVGIGGVANGLNLPAFQSLVSELVPREDLLNGITLTSAQFNIARAIGPGITGVVLASFGASWTFLINGLSFVSVIAALALVRVPTFVPNVNRRSAVREFADALRYIRKRTGLIVAILGGLAMASLALPVTQVATIMARDVFHVGAARYGLLASAYGAGAVIGALLVSFLGGKVRRSRIAVMAMLGYAVVMAGFGAAPNFWLGLIALGLCGLFFINCVPVLNTCVQLEVEEHMRGRVLAVFFMALTGGFPLGALVQSWLAGVIGARQTVIGTAAVLLLVGLAGRVRPRWLDSLEGQPSAESMTAASPRPAA